MKKLLLLFVVILLGLVFDLLPENTTAKDWFPFYDITFTFQTYVYFIFEHFIKIILSYVIYAEALKYRFALWVFFLLQVGDLLDYLMTYNTNWAMIGPIAISFNTVSPVIFTWALINERIGD